MSKCRIKRVGHDEGLCLYTSSSAHQKRVVCSKCNDQNFPQICTASACGSHHRVVKI